MEKSKVYFTDFRAKPGMNLLNKLDRLIREAGIEKIDFKNKFVAIKMHFGEPGNLAFLRPNYAKVVADIVKELEKPARDPREDMPRPILRSDVLDMKDLKPGMVLKGTVRNVIDFGVFVDIGVHQDGLVHISQITDRFIKHPLEAVSVGDIVDVKVMDVDLAKKRISLTMRLDQESKKK